MAHGRLKSSATWHSKDDGEGDKWYTRNPWSVPKPRRTLRSDVEAPPPQENVQTVGEKERLDPENPATTAFEPATHGNGHATQRQPAEHISQAPNTQSTGLTGQTGSTDDDTEEEPENEETWAEWRKRMFVDDPIPIGHQIKAVLFPHWYTINYLLIFSPIGIGLHFVPGIKPIAVFIINFIAIIPLAGILSNATEELALRVGEVLGGLLNASFGNAVELIVSILALIKGQIVIVKTSLIGSILSNLLLVMGMCFYFGGLGRTHQNFNDTVAQTACSLLALAVGALIIPTAYTWQGTYDIARQNDEELSRGTAIILLFVYICLLIFQLKTHKSMYNKSGEKVKKRKKKVHSHNHPASQLHRVGNRIRHGAHANSAAHHHEEHEEDEEQPTLTFLGALVTLCAATALIGVNAEFLVDSINDFTCDYGVSPTFVGLILLPIVGNAAEHATAVTVAIKDKMDLAIGVAVGSSMQIALLVLPFSVLLGWWIKQDMTLVFDNFEIAVLFVAVILVNYLIADGKSHWLEGMQLMCLYVIIAVAAYFFPSGDGNAGQCPTAESG